MSYPVAYQSNHGVPCQLFCLLSRSSHPLESLRLENVPVEEGKLILCLMLRPFLVELDITSVDAILTDKTLVILGNQPTTPNEFGCPKLEIFKPQGVSSTDGLFSNMVATGWKAGLNLSHINRLKTVRAEFCNESHPIDTRRLKKLQAEGLVANTFSELFHK